MIKQTNLELFPVCTAQRDYLFNLFEPVYRLLEGENVQMPNFNLESLIIENH